MGNKFTFKEKYFLSLCTFLVHTTAVVLLEKCIREKKCVRLEEHL